MKLLVGVLFAVSFIVLGAFVMVTNGAYNVAATVPDTEMERLVLHSTMQYSVRARAGAASPEMWNEEQISEGFKDFDGMCTVCHPRPGRERSAISKGMRPQPPDLTEASKQWSSAQLFWIIKNGIKMTGMPAFGLTHSDEEIWNIVGFVRRLPEISTQEYIVMMERFGISADHHNHD